MILRWLYNRLHPAGPTATPSTPETQGAAKAAIMNAQNGLALARAREPEVQMVTIALRRQGERNHFAELIEATMRGNG